MGDKQGGWTGSEAWIFLSIGDAGGGGEVTLDRVIAMADSNNHLIPTAEEFSQAIGQLLGAGLVRVSDGRYSLTDPGVVLYKRINSPSRGHIQRFVETAKLWKAVAPSSAPPVTWEIGAEEFHQAWLQYHAWFEAWSEKFKERRNPKSR